MPRIVLDRPDSNDQRTAVCIWQPVTDNAGRMASAVPSYVAVRGDTAEIVKDLVIKQKKNIRIQHQRFAAVILAAILTSVFFFLLITEDIHRKLGVTPPLPSVVISVIGGVMVLIYMVILILPAYQIAGRIKVDGIKITEDIYRHLTPNNRDALFLAEAEKVLPEALELLDDRYSAAKRKHHEEDRRNREKALALMDRTGSPDTPTPKAAPDPHERHL